MSGSAPRRVKFLTVLRLARGRTVWSVDGERFEVREGMGFLLVPGCLFGGLETSDALAVEVEKIEIRTSLASILPLKKQALHELEHALQTMQGPCFDFDPVAAALFRSLHSGSHPTGTLAFQSGIFALLAHAAQPAGSGQLSDTESLRRVSLFLAGLEHTCDEPWTLETMASAAGLRRSRFGALCRELTGENPSTFLNRVRIRRGRELLRSTSDSITEIAGACGFGTSQYFARVFRKFQGHDPSHYRRLAAQMQKGERIAYIKGDSGRIVTYADRRVGAGDFVVEGEVILDRLGGTAASLEFGKDRFGFDGREGRLFLEGETFGAIRYFEKSAEVIREGLPFRFLLKRCDRILYFFIGEKEIFSLPDDPAREPGRIGLRPLRNGIYINEFRIDGAEVALVADAV